ncbi:XRE family transcriptional regulator [Amycolatopsis samaneae]
MHNIAGGAANSLFVQSGAMGDVWVGGPAADEQPIVPRQLPLALRDFTGRADHLAALDSWLPGDDGPGGDVVISAVDGAAGVGKTALAIRWSYRVQHRFPDGTLYANLRGYGPGEPATPDEVLAGFLSALGVPSERIPVGVEARSGLYRSVLAERRVLIVLDNAHAAEQVRPLLPGGAGCVVVTSRSRLTGLAIGEGATRITVDLFTEQEALELARAVLGPQRADAEPGAVAELIRACAQLPLALRIAAGRVAAQPYLTVADLVAELNSEQGRWEALSVATDERTAVRAVFDWSYRRLSAEQARMFRRLGLHPGPEISLHAAAAAAGLDVVAARRLLDALAEGHLIEQVARDRYRLHDLLRAYAAERANTDDAPEDRDHARRVLLEWYAHHIRSVHRVIIPTLDGWHAGAGLKTRASPEIAFPGAVEAYRWITDEYLNFIAAVRAAARHDLPHLTVLMADLSVLPLLVQGHWSDAFDACRLGLAAARRIGDRIAEYFLLLRLGTTHRNVAQWQEVDDAFQAALTLARDLGDAWLQAEALSNLGHTYVEHGQYVEAGKHLRAALPLSPGAQFGYLEAFIEFNLSAVCTGLGDFAQALRHAERSLELHRKSGNRDVEAYILHYMAKARQGAGAHAEAIELCEKALRIEPVVRDPRNHAFILDTLGDSLRHTGDTARAITCWREALAIFDHFDYHQAPELRERLRALESDGG